MIDLNSELSFSRTFSFFLLLSRRLNTNLRCITNLPLIQLEKYCLLFLSRKKHSCYNCMAKKKNTCALMLFYISKYIHFSVNRNFSSLQIWLCMWCTAAFLKLNQYYSVQQILGFLIVYNPLIQSVTIKHSNSEIIYWVCNQ